MLMILLETEKIIWPEVVVFGLSVAFAAFMLWLLYKHL